MKLTFFLLFAVFCAFAAPVKNLPLVNQEGKPFQLYDLKGSYVLVTFIYTRCPLPNMCPLSMKLTRQAMMAWKKDPALAGKPIKALAVTLDPERDTPPALRAYARRFSLSLPEAVLATGDPQALAEFAGEFNVMGLPNQGTIAHNSKHILLDPQMNEVAQFKDNEWKTAAVLDAVKKPQPSAKQP